MSLVRIDSAAGRTFGWQARRRITGTRRYKSAFFSDRKYGSSRRALAAASAALADMARRWPAMSQARPRTAEQARRLARARWDRQPAALPPP